MATKLAQKFHTTNFSPVFLTDSHHITQFCLLEITKRHTSLSDSKLLCTFAENLSDMSILEKLHAEGTTIVMVTHEEDLLKYSTRIIRIDGGKIM